jgi:uncharacterized protein (UPF0335 family)
MTESLHNSTKDQLKTIVARIERLEEEKADLSEDIKGVYAEAKSNGFDVKILRKIIGLRKKDSQELMEQEMVLATYLHALDMAAPLPLFAEETKERAAA